MAGGEYYRFIADKGAGRDLFGEAPAGAFSVATRPADCPERRFLLKLGFSKPFLGEMESRAVRHATSIEDELLADGSVRADLYYAAVAKALGLPFLDRIDPETIADTPGLDSQLLQPMAIRVNLPDRPPVTAIIPKAAEVAGEMRKLALSPELRASLAVTTPGAIREAVWAKGAGRRLTEASDGLFECRPECSARIVFSGGQGFIAGLLLTTLATCLAFYPEPTILFVHMILSLTYLAALLLRGRVARAGTRLIRPTRLTPIEAYPVYTVMVPLYREAEIVGQLVDRLDRLNWPRSRLDIKLVCEADDLATIEALKALPLRPEYQIVEVPPGEPRTKPKALNFGLAGARGEFLVIYDAEDRPHPDQLREAYLHFSRSPPEVACLQAPLIIANAQHDWLTGLFALEYSGLFRRVLPFLGIMHLPMPLGGTSNHFRVSTLRAVGGWDPHNVTEDADLGLRLCRLGYLSEMISRSTLEDAPTEKSVWLGQRTRWFKGWMQTWLVIMRRPVAVAAELGLGGVTMFHMLITGMLVSALFHPLILVFLATAFWQMAFGEPLSGLRQVLFVLDCVNAAGSYLLFAVVGYGAMIGAERQCLGTNWRYVPFYWMMMSWAAWRALYELHTRPFFWKKTPHRPSARVGQTDG